MIDRMSSRALVVCLSLVCACSENATRSTSPAKDPVDQPDHSAPKTPPAIATTPSALSKVVKVPMFGEVSIADGAIVMMDGGIHGVQGHTITIPATGHATWERRLDGMQPNGKAGAGQLDLAVDEANRLHGWVDGLWQLAPAGNASFDPPINNGPPRWVWAIVLRRGDAVRVLSGGGISSPTGAPDPAKSVLEWLVTRVDAASVATP